MNQQGGLRQINTDKTDIQRLIDMLTNATKVSILSDTSAFGVILKINVTPDFSEYNDYQSNKPVKKFVVKITFASNTDDKSKIPYHYEHDYNYKYTETFTRFFNEAKTQQEIWLNSVLSGDPICPPIASICLFQNNSAKKFVHFLANTNKFKQTNKKKYMLNSLIHFLEMENSGIGVILMPLIDNSFTYKYFLSSNYYNTRHNNIIMTRFIAKIVFLLYNGIVHCDIHNSNVLIQTKDSSGHPKLTPILIDFGIVNDIDKGIIQSIFKYCKANMNPTQNGDYNNNLKTSFILNALTQIKNQKKCRQKKAEVSEYPKSSFFSTSYEKDSIYMQLFIFFNNEDLFPQAYDEFVKLLCPKLIDENVFTPSEDFNEYIVGEDEIPQTDQTIIYDPKIDKIGYDSENDLEDDDDSVESDSDSLDESDNSSDSDKQTETTERSRSRDRSHVRSRSRSRDHLSDHRSRGRSSIRRLDRSRGRSSIRRLDSSRGRSYGRPRIKSLRKPNKGGRKKHTKTKKR